MILQYSSGLNRLPVTQIFQNPEQPEVTYSSWGNFLDSTSHYFWKPRSLLIILSVSWVIMSVLKIMCGLPVTLQFKLFSLLYLLWMPSVLHIDCILLPSSSWPNPPTLLHSTSFFFCLDSALVHAKAWPPMLQLSSTDNQMPLRNPMIFSWKFIDNGGERKQ